MRQDIALKNRILSQYRENVDEKQIRKLRESIADIRYTYSDRSGFVDWRNASDYISAMEGFLYDNVQPLIDRDLLEYAFDLTCQVFLAIGTTDIDDDGCVAIGADTCCKFWKNIADKASDEFQKTMYWWLENQLGSGSIRTGAGECMVWNPMFSGGSRL